MKRYTLLVYLIALWPVISAAQQFRFTANCASAYQHLISLRIAPAQQLLVKEKKEHPDNLIPYFLDNYADFMVLFFNEDPAEYDGRKNNRSKRLEMMRSGPANSPLTLFTQAIINLQWAAVEMKFNNRWSGAMAFRDAFKLANENKKKFPSFSPNHMITGPMQMVAATIPKNLQWLSGIMGIHGSMKEGQASLDKFLNANDSWAKLFYNEGIFYHTYLQFHLLNEPDEALSFVRSKNLDLVNNHLFTYMAANLSLNNRQSAITQQIVSRRNTSAEYLQTPVWDFEMAYARLYHLEPDAGIYFERFLKNFKGKYYLKDAWLRLAWHYLINGNTSRYQYCLNQVKTKGNIATDADKRAQREAREGKQPNVLLLKARLLSDGGYGMEALQLLNGKNSNDFSEPSERLEFMYRVGRVYDDLGQHDRALAAYNNTIAFGRQRSEYFAARAALQAGMIMEEKGDLANATSYYKTCIGMENHDFENALEQKAKAGLERCKKSNP